LLEFNLAFAGFVAFIVHMIAMKMCNDPANDAVAFDRINTSGMVDRFFGCIFVARVFWSHRRTKITLRRFWYANASCEYSGCIILAVCTGAVTLSR
jgi:hypothetical protein